MWLFVESTVIGGKLRPTGFFNLRISDCRVNYQPGGVKNGPELDPNRLTGKFPGIETG